MIYKIFVKLMTEISYFDVSSLAQVLSVYPCFSTWSVNPGDWVLLLIYQISIAYQ